jgi:hypothetical protein
MSIKKTKSPYVPPVEVAYLWDDYRLSEETLVEAILSKTSAVQERNTRLCRLKDMLWEQGRKEFFTLDISKLAKNFD